MNYQEALDFIKKSARLGSKLGLERLQKLLVLLGHPEDKLKFIHVAGTNGKGSTSAMLSSILSCAGYKTGLFTSPYLEVMNEQIRINGETIDNEAFVKNVKIIKDAVILLPNEDYPTEFELITAIAFNYFLSQKCDIVVLETGMGGQGDATNVIPTPLISVLTNIGLDHTAILGDSLTEIARCKAGIIKENGVVVSYEQESEVEKVIQNKCVEKNAKYVTASFAYIQVHDECLSMQKFSYQSYCNLSLPLIGEHQRKNAAVALEVITQLRAQGYNISDDMVKRGLFQVSWPARFEILAKKPLIILDGGHNEQCIDEVVKVLGKYVPDKKVIFVIGVMADKNYKGMIRKLLPIAKEFYTVKPNNQRALDAITLAMAIHDLDGRATAECTVEDGIMSALESAQPSDVICILGSLYMASKVRGCFMA